VLCAPADVTQVGPIAPTTLATIAFFGNMISDWEGSPTDATLGGGGGGCFSLTTAPYAFHAFVRQDALLTSLPRREGRGKRFRTHVPSNPCRSNLDAPVSCSTLFVVLFSATRLCGRWTRFDIDPAAPLSAG